MTPEPNVFDARSARRVRSSRGPNSGCPPPRIPGCKLSRQSEVSYRMGKRHGPSLGWWENGRPETVAAYADDKLTQAKAWDRDGKLVADDQFEADGSRKLRR